MYSLNLESVTPMPPFSIAADLCRRKATPEQLYEAISKQVNVPPAQIQAELEAALDTFWAEGDISYYRQITGYATTEKPDVSELAIHNYCYSVTLPKNPPRP